MDQNKLRELTRRLIEDHPNWPAGKARWLAERVLR
jgi:hypothetical protein